MRVFGCNPGGRACQQVLRAKHLLTMRCFRQRKGNSIRRQVRTPPQLRYVWGTIQVRTPQTQALFGELKVSKNLSSASAVWGVFTMGKPKPDRDCLHMHFHCETAGAQHEVPTKSATHVIPVLDIEGVLCSSAMTTHQEGAAALLPQCSVAAEVSVRYIYTHAL
jgi:hypothetical protein